MKPKISLVDYGLGNILSVTRAFEHVGAEVEKIDTPEQILNSQHLVIPGVGAFADGMAGLNAKGLVPAIREYAKSGRPLLGICLGMQMLLDCAEEFGHHEGLGIIPGRVLAIPPKGTDGQPHRIPHIGWNELTAPTNWHDTIFANLPDQGASVYFVHSFAAYPTEEKYRLANTYYNGQAICAAVRSGSVYGCQFHPEKSGDVGLTIIKGFAFQF